ncbi:hypothetical protein [Chitinophaga tropicalis]|uniref:Uncharacterized protein n=1 Tax=Chitinophaga tropicalis TaxID=2683588 RepID=A0A7K1U4R2_9BACT|nr:hypothetical protein [Chitinophaga tropicalis]MVT09344.1 hypothetical protein [Chitinophaga tropicalis]
MLHYKTGQIPDLPYKQAVKKPIPIRCIQINEPFRVNSMEGVVEGKAGDYLMIGVHEEMYVCDREIFEKTYDLLP